MFYTQLFIINEQPKIHSLPYVLQIKFHRETHLDRCESIYKVGAAATGLPHMGQHLDRSTCFRDDKVRERNH